MKMSEGDIVKFEDPLLPCWNGMVGIILKFYHEGNDALVLLQDGKLFLDRKENFVLLS